MLRLALNPAGLVGPILGKELRCASRRGRLYTLRLAYGVVLGLYVVLTWSAAVAAVPPQRNGAWAMAGLGRTIVASVLLFQFYAVQIAAVIIMSTSVSGEIHGGTLATLLTTPITSFQIVTGKLLGGLSQLIVLVVVSLPILAIARVFGGVPWDEVVAGLCITLTAAMFVGALAMFFSAVFRRNHLTIVTAVFCAVGLQTLLLLVAVLFGGPWAPTYVNPDMAVRYALSGPGSSAALPLHCPLHCLIMLALTAGMLVLCAAMVRDVAARKAFGDTASRRRYVRPMPRRFPPSVTTKRLHGPEGRRLARYRTADESLLQWWPILWKELRTPILGQRKPFTCVVRVVLTVLCLSYLLFLMMRSPAGGHAVFTGLYVVAGTAITGVLAVVTLAAERDARTLPFLLTTSLSARRILREKALAVLVKCRWVWYLLLGHAVAYVCLLDLHPTVLVHLVIVAVGCQVFVLGTGQLFAVLLGRMSTAILWNLGLCVVLWLALPLAAPRIAAVVCPPRQRRQVVRAVERACALANPVRQTVVATSAAVETAWGRDSHYSGGSSFRWARGPKARFLPMTSALALSALMYCTLGLAARAVAASLLRRRAM